MIILLELSWFTNEIRVILEGERITEQFVTESSLAQLKFLSRQSECEKLFTGIVWKANCKRGFVNFLFKQIFLVEEEDN